MKSFPVILLIGICLIINLSHVATRRCPETRKCDKNPIIASNGCRCKVFRDDCELKAAEIIYDPPYSPVDPRECYDCFVDIEWIKNDKDCPRKRRESDEEIQKCMAEVEKNCQDNKEPIPVYSRECGCKIFESECLLKRFNCEFYSPEFVYANGTTKCDDCIYAFFFSEIRY